MKTKLFRKVANFSSEEGNRHNKQNFLSSENKIIKADLNVSLKWDNLTINKGNNYNGLQYAKKNPCSC